MGTCVSAADGWLGGADAAERPDDLTERTDVAVTAWARCAVSAFNKGSRSLCARTLGRASSSSVDDSAPSGDNDP